MDRHDIAEAEAGTPKSQLTTAPVFSKKLYVVRYNENTCRI
jgi:hypothetical protein